MKVVLPLNGGINSDSDPLYIKEGEVTMRKNCRVTSTDGGREGINTSIKSMLQVATMSGANNKVIGFVEDKERNRAVIFVYGTVNKIYIFLNDTLYDSTATSSVLNFNSNEIIDATILGDYCVWCSDYNPPRKIRISGFSTPSEEFLFGKDQYYFQLAVRPPSTKPTTQVASDTSRVVNKLVGKTFQFAYLYQYSDYTYSVLSPYSDLVVSGSLFNAPDNTYDNNNVGNYVQVTYDLGNTNVRAVKLLAREGNSGGWFVVEEYETGGATGSRTIDFYNDVARKALVETEALALYSDVPLRARTVVAVQNRIGLGNVLKGYDKTEPRVLYDVEYETVDVDGDTANIATSDGFDGDNYYIEFTIPSVTEGQVVSTNIFSVYQELNGATSEVYFQWRFSYSYTVQAGEVADDIVNAIVYTFQNTAIEDVMFDVIDGDISEWAIDASNEGSGVVRLYFIGVHDAARTDALGDVAGTITLNTLPQGISTFKSGSYYNVGVVLYDEFSRTSGVLSPQKIYIPHVGERPYANAYDRARITFNIPVADEGIPSWAKYMRFAVTESVNFTGVYPFVVGNAADNIKSIFLDGKSVLAINMPTNFNYVFQKGDYLHIDVDSGAAITNTIQKMIIGTRDEIDISGTATAGFWLIVPKGDEDAATYEENLAYIYRTKDQVADLIYYEDSTTYEISGGEIQTLTGYVGGEDAWYVQRKFEWSGGDTTEVVEDFYLNVDAGIRAYSKGRVLVEFDTLGQIRLQDFVWSFNYLDNTKINGISTFNSLNRVQLDEKDGQIQRIRLVGDVVKVIQDNKETSLYVGKQQITNADGTLSLVKSNNFIGTVNPSEEEFGSRFPRSIVNYGRTLWYYDSDKGQVIRSSPNGMFPISDYKRKSTFLALKDSDDVFAFYDIKNEEYVITFVNGSDVVTHVFKENADVWNIELEYTDANGTKPDWYGLIKNQVYVLIGSKIFKTEAGSDYNSFLGDYKDFLVRGVVNVLPTEEKCLKALKMDSNVGMDVNITSPYANTRPVGQKTVLYEETWRGKDGSYFSPVFKNIMTIDGEDLSLIHSGTDIVGKKIELEFVSDSIGSVQLRLVTANVAINRY